MHIYTAKIKNVRYYAMRHVLLGLWVAKILVLPTTTLTRQPTTLQAVATQAVYQYAMSITERLAQCWMESRSALANLDSQQPTTPQAVTTLTSVRWAIATVPCMTILTA